MSDTLGGALLRSLPMLAAAASPFLLGLLMIPFLRRLKTGGRELRIGSRFLKDGSEPSLGGAVAGISFAVWFFTAALVNGLPEKNVGRDTLPALILSGCFVVMMTAVSGYDEFIKKFRGQAAGVKPLLRFICEYLLCFSLTVLTDLYSGRDTAVLLPFSLGYIEFGILYYPLTALFMMLCIGAFKLHFCLGDDYSRSEDGLSELSGALSLAAAAIACTIAPSASARLLSQLAGAVCAGMLVWTFKPSKLISGHSGASFIGAAFAAAVMLSKLELMFLLAALPQIADSAFALINHIRSKRLPRGSEENDPKKTLHAALSESGFSNTAILLIFAVMGAISCALCAVFGVYALSKRF